METPTTVSKTVVILASSMFLLISTTQSGAKVLRSLEKVVGLCLYYAEPSRATEKRPTAESDCSLSLCPSFTLMIHLVSSQHKLTHTHVLLLAHVTTPSTNTMIDPFFNLPKCTSMAPHYGTIQMDDCEAPLKKFMVYRRI